MFTSRVNNRWAFAANLLNRAPPRHLMRAADKLRCCRTFILDYFGAVYSEELLAGRQIVKPLIV
ncbi:hypothetical protein Bdiaspc4_09095 [Bradyrhizobium diazoefficiens]|uniref:Uncharacterized protein n=1 Tax=Bradyrhizobium ottawaense TaxID=931866 RepID=A0A2U8P1S6_9BRAD|nr:hypothetical protein CIT37_04625 [Bradyrhizobium ottawaense]QBP20672.1 hypothetical protein Bdiaspc4_09095 [Bradyrhizobium diazoefficiens]